MTYREKCNSPINKKLEEKVGENPSHCAVFPWKLVKLNMPKDNLLLTGWSAGFLLSLELFLGFEI